MVVAEASSGRFVLEEVHDVVVEEVVEEELDDEEVLELRNLLERPIVYLCIDCMWL